MESAITQLRVAARDETEENDSSLAYLMRLAEAAGPLLINFEDLVGMTLDHPELRLPDEMRMHKGPLCQWAKEFLRTERGLLVCSTNKYIANRKALHRTDPLIGQCYLGLTDICQPLIYRQQVMGIFYYGSVVLAEHQQRLRERVIAECRRQHLDMDQALTALEQVPVLRLHELPLYEARLSKLCQIVATILDGLGLPADCYHSFGRAKEARVAFGGTPRLVVRAVRVINTYLDHPLTLVSIAKRLQCHPKYLGRVFQRSMGLSVADFLLKTRIERACNLLKIGRLDVTRVAYEVGFTDKSNFSRSFRKIMGMPPGQYRKQFKVDYTTQNAKQGVKQVPK
ncbi:helix-turn-helix domain-containing protein [Phycisphaerales bacterium AB-hyl4]|uniref:Helix-turn-helix domain-containing protein n=1 Tax=Natronomicrosphaera hydrolytica TaxID=3242702 RepID=A0ABV4U6L4_9BACT